MSNKSNNIENQNTKSKSSKNLEDKESSLGYRNVNKVLTAVNEVHRVSIIDEILERTINVVNQWSSNRSELTEKETVKESKNTKKYVTY